MRGGAGVAAVGPPRQPGSAGGDFVATTGEANGMGLRAGEAGAAEVGRQMHPSDVAWLPAGKGGHLCAIYFQVHGGVQ